MSDQSKYSFPDYIAKELSHDKQLSESDLQLIEEIYQKAENFSYPVSQPEANWVKIKDRINVDTGAGELRVIKKPITYTILKWAVAAMIIFSVSFGVYRMTQKPDLYLPLTQSSEGLMKKITLPDGSTVTLNTFSEISTNDFDDDQRIVNLSGEAFFDVVHNDKPFIVHTSRGSIKVLGTRFNVRNRKNIPLQVALSTGAVVLTTDKKIYKMHPGEVLTESSDNNIVKTLINPGTLGWLDDKLVFENETLLNIVSVLESQYNVKLIYDSKLEGEKLTLTFDNLNAQQAVDLLSKTLNSKVIVK